MMLRRWSRKFGKDPRGARPVWDLHVNHAGWLGGVGRELVHIRLRASSWGRVEGDMGVQYKGFWVLV